MIQTPGPKDILTLAWWLISHERRALVEATLLSWVILSVNASIASVLLPEVLVQLLGFLLAFFLGFRFSQTYSRWWEARILCGSVVNESRNWRATPYQCAPASSLN